MNVAKADQNLIAKRRKFCASCDYRIGCRNFLGIKIRPHDTCSKCIGNNIIIKKTAQLLEECPVGKW